MFLVFPTKVPSFFWTAFQTKSNSLCSIYTDSLWCAFEYLGSTQLSSNFRGHHVPSNVIYSGLKEIDTLNCCKNRNNTTSTLSSHRNDLFLEEWDTNGLSCGLQAFMTNLRKWWVDCRRAGLAAKNACSKFLPWEINLLQVQTSAYFWLFVFCRRFWGTDLCICCASNPCCQKSQCYWECLKKEKSQYTMKRLPSITTEITLRKV